MAPPTVDRGRIENLTAALEVEYGPDPSQLGGLPGNRAAGSGPGGMDGPARQSAASPVEIVRAPVGVTLMGDYTDYNDGLVLPAAIGLETWIAFRRRLDGRVRVASRGSRGTASIRMEALVPAQSGHLACGEADPDAWSDYVAATAWSLRESALPILGFDGVVDTTVPGGSYTYRLSWTAQDGTHTSSPVTITVPGLALALAGARPNPTTSRALAVRFALRDASPATLEFFDVGGRRAYGCNVGALGAGEHTLDLSGARLRPGLYFARLTQQGESRGRRITIVP